MNAFEYRAGELCCENVHVTDIAERFGTPVWIYSKAKLLHELNAVRTAFAAVDPVICYSVKANSNLSILKLLNEAGSSFDVVSGGELFRVKKAGADTTRVVFAGVGKTDAEIRQGLEDNILMFNVESEGVSTRFLRWQSRWGGLPRSRCGSTPTSTGRRTPRRPPARRATSSGWTSSGTTNWPRRCWLTRIWSCAGFTCTSVRRS